MIYWDLVDRPFFSNARSLTKNNGIAINSNPPHNRRGEAFGRQYIAKNQRFHVQMLRPAHAKFSKNPAFCHNEIFDDRP
jgi:hypothetical protein